MALRFQGNDEVDRAAKEERHTGGLAVLLVLYALIDGAFSWFRGESLASYGKNLAWLVGFGFVYWVAAPFYYEFRIRTKEIDGKLSAIEATVIASKEGHSELLEKLTAIEEKLEELSEKVENLNPGESVTYSTSGIREGLRTIEERLNRTESPK
jgi:hypothetical protein